MIEEKVIGNIDKKIRIAFHTLGCKLNFSETSAISRDFKNDNFIQVSFSSSADVYVINTCSVTDNADKKLKFLTRKVLRQNPNGFIAVIGCYAQLQPKSISSIYGVKLVLGADKKFKLKDYIVDLIAKSNNVFHSCEINSVLDFKSSYSLNSRTRSFLKIQDGCDYKCSYCTIPKARGISRSDSIENILENIKKITKKGIKEIVLTGVNIGDYGLLSENGQINRVSDFLKLLKAIENHKYSKRVRISSIEPNLLSDEIIDFFSTSKVFVPHFHIPLQSGSDKILNKMKRRYLSNYYEGRVKKIKKLIPNACIGADVIVGFPGESDDDFLDTYNFIKKIDLSYLHVFTYSERPGTESIKFPETVENNKASQRSILLRKLSDDKKNKFYTTQLGGKFNILLENINNKGYIYGYTENYIRVRAPWDPSLKNNLIYRELELVDSQGYVRFKNSN